MSEIPKSSELTTVQHDDLKPSTPAPTLDERHAQYQAEARAKLAGRLPSGYASALIRCDDEPKDSKPPVITPETASRLLGAMADLSERAGLTRKDAVPAQPLNKEQKEDDPPPNPKKGVDEDEEGETGLAKLTRMAEGLSQMLLKMNERLDTIEGKGKREDSGKEKDEPEPIAADSQIGFEPKHEVLFSDAQSRADRVYTAFGGSASPPMSGESLMAYRRRLLRPLLSHSETFKNLDVGVASIDRKLFDLVEKTTHKEAFAASKNPLNNVPGYLQMREHTKDGHTYRTFHGSPMVWLRQFMPTGKAVTKINLRPPTEPARW